MCSLLYLFNIIWLLWSSDCVQTHTGGQLKLVPKRIRVRELRTERGTEHTTVSELFSAQQQLLGHSRTDKLSLSGPRLTQHCSQVSLIPGKIFISKIKHVSQLIFLKYLRMRKRWKEERREIDWGKMFYLWIKTSGKNKGGERERESWLVLTALSRNTSLLLPCHDPDYGDILTFIYWGYNFLSFSYLCFFLIYFYFFLIMKVW